MVTLAEYGTAELTLTRGQAAALQRTGFVAVSPIGVDQWQVTASSYVGTPGAEGAPHGPYAAEMLNSHSMPKRSFTSP